MSIKENHAQAPICAAFVCELRKAFPGAVHVTHVKEGQFEQRWPLPKILFEPGRLQWERAGRELFADK